MKKQLAYMQVYNSIKQEIIDGIYNVGDLLPTEPMLEKKFDVSRTTVRKAIDLLSREGFIAAKQGKGTEVLNQRTTQRLNYVTSFSQTLVAKGYNVLTKGLHIDEVIPPKNVSLALKLGDNEKAIRIQRIQCCDEKPICLMTNYFKRSFAPNIINDDEGFVSLYKYLYDKYGIKFDMATEYISARNSTYTEAQLLNIQVGEALLISKRISYISEEPVEYAHLKIIGNKYDFVIYLNGHE